MIRAFTPIVGVLSAYVLASGTANAATVVINVSSVPQLYSAFSTADSRPADLHEIRLAPGLYRLLRNYSPSDPTDETNRTAGSLKLTAGKVKLVGGANRSVASNYVIDGDWTVETQTSTGVFFVTSNTFRPELYVYGITVQNSFPRGASPSPMEIRGSRFEMYESNVVRTRTEGRGGAALRAESGSSVKLFRCQFNSATIKAAMSSSRECGGVISSGGAIYLSSSSADIGHSTIMQSVACRGGGIYFTAGSSARSLTVQASTITSNSVKMSGGGIQLVGSGNVNLYFNTITDNTSALETNTQLFPETRAGGGVFFQAYVGRLNMAGNIIAKNLAVNPFQLGQPTPNGKDCFIDGSFTTTSAQNGNILGERGNCTFVPAGPLVGSSSSPIDPMLGGLSEGEFPSGGSIIVRFPQFGSIALQRYQPSGTFFCQSQDQIGTFRTTPCTIGSIETAQ